jgi:hypothetical protein
MVISQVKDCSLGNYIEELRIKSDLGKFINLTTTDSRLQDALLADYPGVIKPEQYGVDKAPGGNSYYFWGLNNGKFVVYWESEHQDNGVLGFDTGLYLRVPHLF